MRPNAIAPVAQNVQVSGQPDCEERQSERRPSRYRISTASTGWPSAVRKSVFTVPGLPANVGTFEVSCTLALGAVGVAPAAALSFALVPFIGEDRVVWGSDYPHADSTFPGAVKELAATIGLLPPQARRRILGENAADLYRL